MSEGGRHSGQLIGGKYELQKVLGAGGMGEVWAARHTSLQTSVALKFLKGSSASEPETRSRFELEARVTAQLKTRLAVQVFDYGVAVDGQPFLVMELLEGESLAQRILREVRFAPAVTAQLLGQAARALDKAHALGIVHRDFKPGNVFITLDEDRQEQVKVMDFGLAKIMGELETRGIATAEMADDASPSAFTRTGALLGTPSYMSPEQVACAPDIGPAADVWAFGVVAYECLIGRLPFLGSRMSELFDAIRQRRYQRGSSLAPLPAAFDEWFEVACAQEPARRFANAGQAMQELSRALGLSLGPEVSFGDRPSGPQSLPQLAAVTPYTGHQTPPASGLGFEPTLKRDSSRPRGEPSTVKESSSARARLPVVAGAVVTLALAVGAGTAFFLRGPPPPPPGVLAAPPGLVPPPPPPGLIAPLPEVPQAVPSAAAPAPVVPVAPVALPAPTKAPGSKTKRTVAPPPPMAEPTTAKPAEPTKPKSLMDTPELGIPEQ